MGGERTAQAAAHTPTLTDVVTTLVHPRQGAASRAARALARRARRDRPLGAAEARHRRPAHRRIGAARQDRGRGARRQGARRDRTGLARPRRRPISICSPGSKAAPDKPESSNPAPFRPVMLSHAIEETDFADARPGGFLRRMEMGRHPRAGGRRRRGRWRSCDAALFAHAARIFPAAFPILPMRCTLDGAIDGELLILRDGPRAVVQRAAAAAQPQDA